MDAFKEVEKLKRQAQAAAETLAGPQPAIAAQDVNHLGCWVCF